MTTLLLTLTLMITEPRVLDHMPQDAEWTHISWALGQLESGEDDRAVGASGEITRYQILPEVFAQFGGRWNYRMDREHAWYVARKILRSRMQTAVQVLGSRPSPEMIYLLWNAPRVARAAKYDFTRVTNPVLRDRATRFSNLHHFHSSTTNPQPLTSNP